jgi:hypothetical protein
MIPLMFCGISLNIDATPIPGQKGFKKAPDLILNI